MHTDATESSLQSHRIEHKPDLPGLVGVLGYMPNGDKALSGEMSSSPAAAG